MAVPFTTNGVTVAAGNILRKFLRFIIFVDLWMGGFGYLLCPGMAFECAIL